jgi:hypothetical protein
VIVAHNPEEERMADQFRPDNLAPIYARLAAQDAEITRLRYRRRLPRRALPLLLAVLLVALVPLATLAANPFVDLVPGSVHNANIDAIYNAGITTGCDPHVAYCPTDFVTRQEMASFLARTAGVGGNPPVANARTAIDASTALNAGTAQNALALGDQPASAYQLAGQPIANAVNAQSAGNANTVGGFAPSALVRVARADDGTGGGFVRAVGTGGFQTFVTLTITAPQAGFILVNGQAYVQHSAAGTSIIYTRLRNTGNNQTGVRSTTYMPFQGEMVGLTWVFPVAAGPQTFVLEAQALDTNWALGNAVLTGLYIPFGSTGGAALETPEPTTPPADAPPAPGPLPVVP